MHIPDTVADQENCLGLPENRKSLQITANQPQITANQAQHNVILPENRKSPQITADKADKQTVNR